MRDFDADIEIMVPEYIVFRHETSGPVSRFFAVFMDLFAVLAFFVALVMVLVALGIAGAAAGAGDLSPFLMFVLLVSFFATSWLYFIAFEWFNRGRTPGKMLLGLRVVSLDGTALDMVQILIRNLLRIADMFPFTSLGFTQIPSYFVGGLSAFITGRTFQRLGDLAAGTIVIRERKGYGRVVGPSSEAAVAAVVARMQLRRKPAPALARALNDYVERRDALSPARRSEIAHAVEGPLRSYFGAEQIECEPEEVLLAAHEFMYRLPRQEDPEALL